MKLVELSTTERHDVYNNHLVKDFHKSEVKPLDMIESLVEDGNYSCYGFYEDEDFLGYAYFVKPTNSSNLLIDYLAVCNGYRSKGLGTEFIEVLKTELESDYSSLLAEVEDPEFSVDKDDLLNRERRISFYLRNGFELSGLQTHVLVDNYRIIKLGLRDVLEDDEVCSEISEIYRTIFGEEFCNKHITVSL